MFSFSLKPKGRHGLMYALLLSLFLLAAQAHAAFNFKSLSDEQPDFLPVDEAFIFDSQITAEGLNVSWDIHEGYYLYQSKVKYKSLNGQAKFGDARFSDMGVEEEDPYFGITRVVYNALELDLPITLGDGSTDAEIEIEYQGCATAGLCYPPTKRTVMFFPPADANVSAQSQPLDPVANAIQDEVKDEAPPRLDKPLYSDDASSIFAFMDSASLWTVVGIFFLLGLGLTFTPCVLPMIPIITTIVAGQSQTANSTGRSIALASSYVAGMALTYASLGLMMGLLGASANFQAAMQHPLVLLFFALIFVLLALAMFGAYTLQLPAFIRDKLEAESQKLGGGKIVSVFTIGALSALLVSPCVSAPLAGALLYISASGDGVLGFASLLSLGLGMGLPLLLVAVGGARFLPKAGKWMDATKFIFGMMLLSVAVWLVGRLIPGNIALGLWSLLLLATSVYIGAFDQALTVRAKLTKTLGLALFMVSAIWLLGAFSGASDPFNPLERLAGGSSNTAGYANTKFDFDKVGSKSELDAALARASDEGKPAFVDVYADWCISCIIMEREVFVLADVKALLDQFYLIKADVTHNTQENIDLLEEYDLFGPPSYLFFTPNSIEQETLRIVGETSKERFVNRLESALTQR